MEDLDDIDMNCSYDENKVAGGGGGNDDGVWNERIQKGRIELNKI
jgi:hypothetical protein